MLKILQTKLQQYVNWELADGQSGFQGDRGTRDQIANNLWIMEKAREFQEKISTFASLTTLKALTIWITADHGKFLKRWEWPNRLTCLLRNLYAGQEETVRTGHGTMDIWTMVQNWERSKTRLYIVTLLIQHLHRVHHTKPGWLNHKLESRLPGELSTTSDMHMIPL